MFAPIFNDYQSKVCHMENIRNDVKQWTVRHPGFLIFMIDQSHSMQDVYSEEGSKADFTAKVINRTIYELINMNLNGETIKDRMKIAVVGYGGQGGDSVQIMRAGMLSSYANNPLQINKAKQKVVNGDLVLGEIEVEQPVYVNPLAKGSTAMGKAFQLVRGTLVDECKEQGRNYSETIVINISDGSPWSHELKFKERDLALGEAQSLMRDGVLIYNAHIGNGHPKLICPNHIDSSDGRQAKFLFDISSVIPQGYLNMARKFELYLSDGARGFVSNASPDVLIKFINFGSSGAFAKDRLA